MLPLLDTLRPDRVQQSLAQGLTHQQVAIMFVSNILTCEINNKMPDYIANFMEALQKKSIFEERFEYITEDKSNFRLETAAET